MAIIKKITKRGFTLIELMIVVVIIGILASLAIYGVQKYVASSKSAEAKTMLGRISKDMLSFFEGENQSYQVLGFAGSAGITQSLCDAAGSVPATVPSRAKMMPDNGAFEPSGWRCLSTTWSTPTYYSYSVLSPEQTGNFSANNLVSAASGHSFTAVAQGDLDGDGVPSTFRLGGVVLQDSVTQGLVLTLATTVDESDPEE